MIGLEINCDFLKWGSTLIFLRPGWLISLIHENEKKPKTKKLKYIKAWVKKYLGVSNGKWRVGCFHLVLFSPVQVNWVLEGRYYRILVSKIRPQSWEEEVLKAKPVPGYLFSESDAAGIGQVGDQRSTPACLQLHTLWWPAAIAARGLG